MRLYLTQKRVLIFKNKAREFLNGLTSNAMDAPQNAFLNIHGKIVATFDQILVSDDEIWVILEPEYIDPVQEHISRYLKLARVEVLEPEQHVYFDCDGDASVDDDDKIVVQKQGRLIITAKEREANISDEEFLAFRVQHQMPQLGTDYRDDFVLNVSPKDFVSFNKGCFLGQEPVSKVHNRSKPTWRLVVKLLSECSKEEAVAATSVVENKDTGQKQGFVFEKNN